MPEMQARVMAAIEQRLAVSFGVAAQLKDDRELLRLRSPE
jgi:hypothetical protein